MAIVLHHSKAAGAAKIVLLGIANHLGDGGSWPSVATLARYANVDPRSVQRAITALVDSGEVGIHLRPGKSTSYQVLVRCPEGCDRSHEHRLTPDASVTPTPDAGVTPDTGVRGDASVANPRRQRHPRGDAGVTRTVLEPNRTKKKTPSESSRATPTDRGTRIPDDFGLTPDMIGWARENAPTVGLRDHEAFIDYWRTVPGAKGRKVDWHATWRGWMRREDERRRPQSPGRRSTTTERISQIDQAAAELASQDRAAITSARRLQIEGMTA